MVDGASRPRVRARPSSATQSASTRTSMSSTGLSGPNQRPNSRRAYAADLREFGRWFGPDSPVEDIDVRVLADWVAELGRARTRGRLAPSTISRKLVAIRSLVRYTLGPESVPDASLAPKRPRRLPDAPKREEVDDVVDSFDPITPLGLR